jgi:hypothetical protein
MAALPRASAAAAPAIPPPMIKTVGIGSLDSRVLGRPMTLYRMQRWDSPYR